MGYLGVNIIQKVESLCLSRPFFSRCFSKKIMAQFSGVFVSVCCEFGGAWRTRKGMSISVKPFVEFFSCYKITELEKSKIFAIVCKYYDILIYVTFFALASVADLISVLFILKKLIARAGWMKHFSNSFKDILVGSCILYFTVCAAKLASYFFIQNSHSYLDNGDFTKWKNPYGEEN